MPRSEVAKEAHDLSEPVIGEAQTSFLIAKMTACAPPRNVHGPEAFARRIGRVPGAAEGASATVFLVRSRGNPRRLAQAPT